MQARQQTFTMWLLVGRRVYRHLYSHAYNKRVLWRRRQRWKLDLLAAYVKQIFQTIKYNYRNSHLLVGLFYENHSIELYGTCHFNVMISMIPPSIAAYTTEQSKIHWLSGGRTIYAQLESSYMLQHVVCIIIFHIITWNRIDTGIWIKLHILLRKIISFLLKFILQKSFFLQWLLMKNYTQENGSRINVFKIVDGWSHHFYRYKSILDLE